MSNPTYPGVYMEEVSSGVRPIEAAGTSTAAFFGYAQRGPIGVVKKIFSFSEFQIIYGGFLDGHYLAYGVYQFFNNGGGQCYIGRVALGAETASVTVKDNGSTAKNSLTISASSPGIWGNTVSIAVTDASEDRNNLFALNVYGDNPKAGEKPILLESFDNLSMDSSSPVYVEKIVNTLSKQIRIAVNTANDNQQAGYSESSIITLGGELLAAKQRTFRINIHGDGFQVVNLTKELTGKDLTKLEDVRGAIEKTIRALKPLRDSTPAEAYTVTVTIEATNKLRITSGHISADSRVEIIKAENAQEDAAGALKLGKANGGKEVFGSSAMRPQATSATDWANFYLLGDDTVAGAVSAVVAGSDGSTPQVQDYVTALSLLDTIRDVSIIAVPGIGSFEMVDAGMNYCARRPLSDCFYVADMTQEEKDLESVTLYRDKLANPNSYGAIYFPWIKALDPTGKSKEAISLPPSGFLAGIYARTDAKRGVWKAPAGTEATVSGAVGLVTELTDTQHGNLNKDSKSVCVVRKFPGAGIVVWGSRTLSSDPEWKYIPVRRMAIMLRVSIFNGIQWAVFEPNDEELWSQLRLNIGSFMMNLYRQGAFQGSKPSDAFFVKCDKDTTTQDDINLGIVNVLVGFAPLKPAEFVIVKISQMAGQSS